MSESSEFERKLESGLGDEPSRQRRQTALNFVIAKCEAYRDFAALVVPVLTRLSASDAATTKAMRGELLALISSREYLDLRARCERLQALTRQGTTVMSVRVRIIGSFPKALGDDLMGSLYSLERAVRELGADTGQEPPCVYQPESLDRYEPYAETARRLLAKERLKLDADLDAAARAAQREDLYALARRIQQSTQDVSALEAQARLEMGGVDQLLADKIIAREVLRSSPWYSGSFYLTAFVVIVTAISVAQNFVTAWAFPILSLIHI